MRTWDTEDRYPGGVAWRYFKTNEGPLVLARIDLDRAAAERLDGKTWTAAPGLMRIVLTDNNLDFDEISAAEATKLSA